MLRNPIVIIRSYKISSELISLLRGNSESLDIRQCKHQKYKQRVPLSVPVRAHK